MDEHPSTFTNISSLSLIFSEMLRVILYPPAAAAETVRLNQAERSANQIPRLTQGGSKALIVSQI